MIRRIVVLPLPDAPSKTSTSPSATSKVILSSTLVLPKRLLRPTTLAAAGDGSLSDGAGSAGLGISLSLAFTIFFHFELRISNRGFLKNSHFAILIDVEPIAREEQDAEDQERKKRQHDRDRVRGFDLSFIELRKDV